MYSRLQLLTRSPLWAIQPEAIAALLLSAVRPDPPASITTASGEVTRWEAAQPSMRGPEGNKMAIIPIQGVLTQDGPAWYGSNYKTIASAAEAAANDPSVKCVVLSVDSPGGEVTGCPETAAVLANLAKTKPVHTMVEGQCASAAYWLGSQGSDITLTPSGEVGSVGVRMMHADISKMLDNYGVKVSELSSGEHKTEWSPYKPLSEEAKANMQPRLEAVHAEFIAGVSAGRGARPSQEITDARFGEGRMFSSTDALKHGLVDKVQSSREFYQAVMPKAEAAAPTFPIGRAAACQVEVARHKV